MSFLREVINKQRRRVQRPPEYTGARPDGSLMYDEGLAASFRMPAVGGSQGGITSNFRQDDSIRMRQNLGWVPQ